MSDEQLEERAEAPEDGRDAYALDDTLRGELRDAVEAGDVALIDALMEPLHPADIADLLEQVTAGERAARLALWSRGIDGEVLSELDWGLREEVIELLPPEQIWRRCASSIPTTSSTSSRTSRTSRRRDPRGLDDRDRTAVEQALTYPE
jgi:magnesium transporter